MLKIFEEQRKADMVEREKDREFMLQLHTLDPLPHTPLPPPLPPNLFKRGELNFNYLHRRGANLKN